MIEKRLSGVRTENENSQELKQAYQQAIAQAQKLEQKLAVRLQYEQTLSVCSQILLANIETEEALTETLYELLVATGVSRVYSFENFTEDDQLYARQTQEVCALDIAPHPDKVINRLAYQPALERWQKELSRDNVIAGPVENFPPSEQTILAPFNALSVLVLPIWVEGRWFGFVGFDDIEQKREWSREDVQLLQTVVDMIGGYIGRKQAEKAMRESEGKYRTLVEQSGDAIFLIYGGRFDLINPRFTELFGVTQEEALSSDFVFTSIIAPQSRKKLKQLAQDRGRGLERPRYEFTALNKEGDEIIIELTVSYPTYRDGIATQGIIRDITEEKRIEEEKQRAYQQVQQYADELAEKIIEVQRQREIATILAEVVASVSLTLSTDKLLDHILLKLQKLIPYDSAAIFLAKKEDTLVMEATQGFPPEIIHRQESFKQNRLFREMQQEKSYILIRNTENDARYEFWPGAEKVSCWIGAPLLVAQEMIGYLSVDRHLAGAFTTSDAELTQAFAYQVAQTIHNAQLFAELKETQAQLIQRERLAALGQMAATVAHELRNPLMAIRMGVDYLMFNVDENDPRQRGAELMQANMERLNGIVEDILYVARAPKPNLAPGSVRAILKHEMKHWELKLAEKDVMCQVDLAANLSPVLLDPDQLGRAIGNLIGNSLDAVDEKGQLSLTLEQKNNSQVITFKDNGPGIPQENLAKIFEPFFTTKSRGTGLGLAIVKQIIDFHHGQISAESETGVGTTFVITLPLLKE